MKQMYPHVWADETQPPTALGGVTGAVGVTLGGVLKEAPTRKHVVAAEYICGRLALAAGLPVPVGDLISIRSVEGAWTKAYLMLQMSSEAPPPVRGAKFVEAVPDVAARVVAFDALVLNGDRHQKSISLPGDGGVMVYDFSEAFFGSKQADVQTGHEYLMGHGFDVFWGRPTLTEHLASRSGLVAAIDRVCAVPEALVDECIDRTVDEGLLPSDVGVTLGAVLHNRLQKLPSHLATTDPSVFPKLSKDGDSS